MFKRRTTAGYFAVSLATLALCASAQPSMVMAQAVPAPQNAAKRAPSVEVTALNAINSSLEDATLHAILNDGFIGHEHAIRGWNADQLTIPALTVSIPGKTKKATPTRLTYSDVVLTGIENGKADKLTIGSISASSRSANAKFDSIAFEQVDFGNIARVITPENAKEEQFYPLFDSSSIAGGTFADTDDITCAVGEISSSAYQMRPIGATVATLAELSTSRVFDEIDDLATLAPLLTSYAQLVTSVKSGPTNIGGINCSAKMGEDDTPDDRLAIASISIAAVEPGLYPEVKATAISAHFDKNYELDLREIALKPLDFSPLLAALETAPSPLNDEWIAKNERLLSPNFGGFSFAGLQFDARDTDPLTVNVESFDLTLADYINGLPSKADVSANSIVVDIPEDDNDEFFELMRAAGLTQIDGSFRFAGHWDEANQAIVVGDASFNVKDMATVSLNGELTNATRQLFDLDYSDAMSATRALALKAIHLAVTDNGIGTAALAAMSGEMGADAEAMRPIYADLVKGTIIAYLADLAEASDLGDAVSAFVAGTAKHLKIGVTAKAETGISLKEFEEAEDDPTAILSKINVTATAN